MELKEAIERLKNLQDWYKNGNMSTTIESGELEAIETALQALEDTEKANEMELWEIKLRIGLIEEELEVLENYSLNNWQRFGFEKEAVAVKRIRNATNDFRELLKVE